MTETNKKPPLSGIPQSYIAAGIITLLVVGYFTIGTLVNAGKGDAPVETVERPLFTVLVLDAAVSDSTLTVEMSGRTEAGAQIIVRAETPGQVAMTVPDGIKVKKGDILCELNTDSRRAVLAEAQAGVAKAQADYDAAKRLYDEGFTAEAGLKTARAALNSARARETQARLDLANVQITAPFDGVVADVLVDPGDVLGVGGGCAILADLDEIIVAGGLSPRLAEQISVGDRADVSFEDVTTVGTVRFISEVANDRTRAFRVEIDLDSATQVDTAGVTAEAKIHTGAREAVRVPRNAMVFSDDGILGVRTVHDITESGVGLVAFYPIEIIAEDENGIAITGLPQDVLVIVRGQEYVNVGSKVAVERAIGPIVG